MVSIIICSRSKSNLSSVSESISSTIGTKYEIISIDNSSAKYGICEAYNIGAAQAQYEFLCFMHEDVLLHTQNWGSIVATILKDIRIGVIGVAGGAYQPKAPAGWSTSGPYIGINVIHTSNGITKLDYVNPNGKSLLQAISLDGVWLCCRKSVWDEFKFDSVDFPGFHFYDIDFCIRIAAKYSNFITFEILIEHFSHGNFDKKWMIEAISFFKRRKKYLPVSVNKITRTEHNYLDLLALQGFTHTIINNKLHKLDIIYCLKSCIKISPFNRDTLYLIRKFLGIN